MPVWFTVNHRKHALRDFQSIPYKMNSACMHYPKLEILKAKKLFHLFATSLLFGELLCLCFG